MAVMLRLPLHPPFAVADTRAHAGGSPDLRCDRGRPWRRASRAAPGSERRAGLPGGSAARCADADFAGQRGLGLVLARERPGARRAHPVGRGDAAPAGGAGSLSLLLARLAWSLQMARSSR